MSYFFWVLLLTALVLVGHGSFGIFKFIIEKIEKRKQKKELEENPAKVGDKLISPTGREYEILLLQEKGAVFKHVQTGRVFTLNMKQLRSFFDGTGGY